MTKLLIYQLYEDKSACLRIITYGSCMDIIWPGKSQCEKTGDNKLISPDHLAMLNAVWHHCGMVYEWMSKEKLNVWNIIQEHVWPKHIKDNETL